MSAVSTPPAATEEEAAGAAATVNKRRSYPSGGGGAKDGGDRNFRSLYYEKVGFRGVDERKTVEALLAEDPVSREKCAHFTLKFSVPSDRRKDLWKVRRKLSIQALICSSLLACSIGRAQCISSVPEQQGLRVEVAGKALPRRNQVGAHHVHHLINRNKIRFPRSLRVMGKIRDDWPKAKNLAVVYLLFAKQLKMDVARQLEEAKSQDLMAVAEALIHMDQSSESPFDEVEVFWIAKGMFALLGRLSEAGLTEMEQGLMLNSNLDYKNAWPKTIKLRNSPFPEPKYRCGSIERYCTDVPQTPP